MLSQLFPNLYLESIFSITPELLKSCNIHTIVFDIDNTLAPYYVVHPDEKTMAHFALLQKSGVQIGLVSNNNKQRVETFAKPLNVPYLHRASKPMTAKIKKLILSLEADVNHTAIAGDQIFTDVWCGNRLGLFSILIQPLVSKDEWITKIKRGIEKKVVQSYLNREGKHGPER